jgi:hypothetical protein
MRPGSPAKFATSDAEELLGGVQGVLVVPPPAATAATAPTLEQLLGGFPVDADAFTHDGRLQVLPLTAAPAGK